MLGGARSGKSAIAEGLVMGLPPPWTYVATAEVFDDEMAARVAEHRARRDGRWSTLDAPRDLVGVLARLPDGAPVLIDCLTLWLGNHLLAGSDLNAECARLADAFARPRGPWVVVSSEVGLGIVPDNALARAFRDAAGLLNQRIAAVASAVTLVVAGLPLKVK